MVGHRHRAGSARRPRRAALCQALAFVLGFSVVFIALWASVGLVGYVLRDYVGILRQVGGAVLMFMGLHVAGVIELSLLYREVHLPVGRVMGASMGFGQRPRRPAPSYGRSALLGVVFAAGWTPVHRPDPRRDHRPRLGQRERRPQGTLLLVAYAARPRPSRSSSSPSARRPSATAWRGSATTTTAVSVADGRDARRGRLPDDHQHLRPAVRPVRTPAVLRGTPHDRDPPRPRAIPAGSQRSHSTT